MMPPDVGPCKFAAGYLLYSIISTTESVVYRRCQLSLPNVVAFYFLKPNVNRISKPHKSEVGGVQWHIVPVTLTKPVRSLRRRVAENAMEHLGRHAG